MTAFRGLVGVAVTAVSTVTAMVLGTGLAAADDQPYIRMMDVNRYDIVMGSETHNIARDPAKAAWACKEVIGAVSAVGGPLGIFASSTTCISQVTVCAAQASTKGKWAGMTFTIVPPNFWCWTY